MIVIGENFVGFRLTLVLILAACTTSAQTLDFFSSICFRNKSRLFEFIFTHLSRMDVQGWQCPELLAGDCY